MCAFRKTTPTDEIKNSLTLENLEITYIADGEYIKEMVISVKNSDGSESKHSVSFTYTDNGCGFDLVSEADGVSSKIKYEKTVSDGNTSARLTYKNGEIIYSHDSVSGEYSITARQGDANAALLLCGSLISDREASNFLLSIADADKTQLFSFAASAPSVINVPEIPEHISLFDMNKDEMTSFMRAFPMDKIAHF